MHGNCLCGASPYTIKGNTSFATYACHCTDCQHRTGSAFALLMPLPRAWLSLADAAHPVRRRMPSGLEEIGHHCPACKTLLFTTSERRPGLAVLRVGTLDEIAGINPRAHIWFDSRQPWVMVPETAMVFDRAPPEEAWARILAV